MTQELLNSGAAVGDPAEHEVTGNYGEVFPDPGFVRKVMELIPDLFLKRFTIHDKATGRYIATVYAERFEPYAERDSFTGAQGGHFWVGDDVVGSAELAIVTVVDSTGRSWDRKRDIVARIEHQFRRLSRLQAAFGTVETAGRKAPEGTPAV